jgi:16S rRNA pseudouridine516 synthase
VTEGKYHQIKRMFHAVGSEILTLERITFGGLTLDPALERGEWRELTDDEIAVLMKNNG